MGVVSIFTSIVLVGGIQKLGWTKAALIAPIVALVTSAAFFGSLFSSSLFFPLVLTVVQTTPLALTTFFGSLQNCFTKAAKYTVFDATKEMAFIPLEKEERIQGKVAIDGIGPKVAKSLSSFIHQGFLLVFGTLPASAPFVSIVVLTAIALWIIAVTLLGKSCLRKSSPAEAVA
jgi:AAA family ATP:ADP antiporter